MISLGYIRPGERKLEEGRVARQNAEGSMELTFTWLEDEEHLIPNTREAAVRDRRTHFELKELWYIKVEGAQ